VVEFLLFEMQAKACAALGHAKRIQIIDLLQEGEKTAGLLAQEMAISKANLSQHLKVMKNNGLLRSRRDGVTVYYEIANPKIVSACLLMREVLMDQLEKTVKVRENYLKEV
jgi:ArsR family transcriptional regulator